ncbi:hypothetical protein IWW54_000398 [Coemansia sp. RSA 2705]|nr:hypothetical protein IWW54_000398 [Coemansia sp. RSA 2705]
MLLTAEQVLARLKQNGTYDSMRKQQLDAFVASEHGKAFEATANSLLRRLAEDADSARVGDRAGYLERRLVEQLKLNGRMERMERDTRNYWFAADRHDAVAKSISAAIGQLRDGSTARVDGSTVSRPLEVDPPRLPPAGSRGRSHNYYRRGDAVAVFVPVGDSLRAAPEYICLALGIDACDSARNMYSVRDADAAGSGQSKWAVYWDQILAIKRPYEQVYRAGDQVYALYRDDYGADTAVSTEYFPGKVEDVGKLSLAIRYDAGGLAHVFYDEVFAAGRVGFMRQMSDERKRSGAADAMVEVHGRLIPSFTGFWADTAQPLLGKYGRKVRYRQMPPILVEHGKRDVNLIWSQQQQQQPAIQYGRDRATSPAQHSSDMDIDSSADSPSPPRAAAAAVISNPEPVAKQPEPPAAIAAKIEPWPPRPNPKPAGSKQPAPALSSEEEGEIDAGVGDEEGEVHERPAAAAQPARTPDPRSTRPAYRSPSRSSSRYRDREELHWRPRSPRRERRYSRSRSRSRSRWSNRSRDRSRTPRADRGRDFGHRRYSGRQHDEYRPRYRSRSRSLSRERLPMRGPSPPPAFGRPPPPPPPAPAAAHVGRFRPSVSSPSRFNVYDNPVDTGAWSSGNAQHLVGAAGSKWSSEMASMVQAAVTYLQNVHQILPENVRITDAYTDTQSGLTHVYARQVVDGMDVANGLANININANGHVISSSQSFAPLRLFQSSQMTAGSQAAHANDLASLRSALKVLGAAVGSDISEQVVNGLTVAPSDQLLMGVSGFAIVGFPESVAVAGKGSATQELIHTSDGRIARVWHICLQQASHWWSAHVDPELGRVEALNDWAFALTEEYRVLPYSVLSPDDGERQLIKNPARDDASPRGWVALNTTAGNNVWAQTNPSGGDSWLANFRPTAQEPAVFDFPFDAAKQPADYADYSVTQLFYTVNTMHDLSFAYGFTEAAGNFQDINFSGQGLGGDYVVANAQDGSSTNNAIFTSPPDGQHGRMQMYVWTATEPHRDGALEMDIVAHEFTHGISNRLTGGPSNADCLSSGEAAGMGEGWSDIVPVIMRIRPGDTRTRDITMGAYVNGKNIRLFPYSTNTTTNPHMYQDLNKPEYKEEHIIGEVWASILYEVLWNLLDAHGIADDLFAHDLRAGNSLMLQILLDGMKLQPCAPSFIDARNAIIQAEKNLGGADRCRLWQGFAKRGLGIQAQQTNQTHVEDFGVPADCYTG